MEIREGEMKIKESKNEIARRRQFVKGRNKEEETETKRQKMGENQNGRKKVKKQIQK